MENSQKQKDLESNASSSTKQLYQGHLFSVKRDTLQFPDHTYHCDIVVHPGAVMAVPVNKRGKIILIQQWRRAIGKIIYELPAGVPDAGESPEQAIDRELQEEIGKRADHFIPLGGFYSTPGFCTEYIHLFIAKELSPSSLDKDLHEAIDIVEIDLDKALSLIDTNQIEDLKTVAGLFCYLRWLKRNDH